MSDYGKNNINPNDFTQDEKVNLALKVALGRIQTDLTRNWYYQFRLKYLYIFYHLNH